MLYLPETATFAGRANVSRLVETEIRDVDVFLRGWSARQLQAPRCPEVWPPLLCNGVQLSLPGWWGRFRGLDPTSRVSRTDAFCYFAN